MPLSEKNLQNLLVLTIFLLTVYIYSAPIKESACSGVSGLNNALFEQEKNLVRERYAHNKGGNPCSAITLSGGNTNG
jgi:hypothetical protein